MRVFVTGASGLIGSCVVRAFRRAGHSVAGLVRSEASKNALLADEIEPVVGDLHQPNTFKEAMQRADVLVHCAFENAKEGAATDAHVVDALLAAGRPFIYTSGIWVYGNYKSDVVVDESMATNPLDLVRWRVIEEEKVLKGKGVVLRPACVYGMQGGLTALWFSSAKQGRVTIVGDGTNHWPMIHVEDLARCYVLAAEKKLSSIALNVSEGSHPTIRQLGEAVARAAKVSQPLHCLTPAEAEKQFGKPLADALAFDMIMSNERVRQTLGWAPHPFSFEKECERYYLAWRARP